MHLVSDLKPKKEDKLKPASNRQLKEVINLIPIKLPKEERLEIIKSVQNYFEAERSESIGTLGAEQLIDFMINELGPYIYNKAITDARNLINEKMNQIDDELYTLERPNKSLRR